ncbi:hydantoinase/oxoprolinase family protein [Exilibacterium tricleocarpae]|uniref:Hydantoinase/oxoprolinase family protein n=1 Tax=Exilibacterium tricleocarpae TaxID=2591008 RepID=A0A545TNH9_9GAMM|nr:hydantoinase/oxoprolinase family protein [Exilibacterium tricleocarpae]TQV78721.1 hydantoinase/oxoprolinase family protein [Exilibacterium tricleocarpae]
MRLACDTGGTFTDLIVEDDEGNLDMFKASTTPQDPVLGVINAVKLAAQAAGLTLADYLASVDTFIHGTTHAINAVITGNTARTAFLTTRGHPDVLVLREGGRQEPFNFTVKYPEPYIPKAHTFEVPERIGADGDIVKPLDEAAVIAICQQIKEKDIEAVAVCLLWSVANPAHERRIGELIEQHCPGVAYTLSHALNPTIREFRRASATAIDASLKPLMGSYLGSLSARLDDAGFTGRLLVLTSQGGMIDADEIAQSPIRAINSGPSLAPIAGRYFGQNAMPGADIIVADTGGTTYDVSLVRGGQIPLTRDAWIGAPFQGHLTGFPSVDVQSVGAGGGSIAHVDSGGLLKVGPQSAGAVPGPVCYGRGGSEPTLSDACVALGYVDPDYFLGGAMRLDKEAARAAIKEKVADPLGMGVEQAAAAIVTLATENMVQAIADITVNQGIDPQQAVLIGGGGAAGLNSIFIARRLSIPRLVIPEVGAALSAAGALMSELAADYRAVDYMTTAEFDRDRANDIVSGLRQKAEAFLADVGKGAFDPKIQFSVEARYEQQVWEIEVPLPVVDFAGEADIHRLIESMHETHERIFAFRDEQSAVEVIGWSVRASCRVHKHLIGRMQTQTEPAPQPMTRQVWFPVTGATEAAIVPFANLEIDRKYNGPAMVESPFSTVVIDPDSLFWRLPDGSLVIDTQTEGAAA